MVRRTVLIGQDLAVTLWPLKRVMGGGHRGHCSCPRERVMGGVVIRAISCSADFMWWDYWWHGVGTSATIIALPSRSVFTGGGKEDPTAPSYKGARAIP